MQILAVVAIGLIVCGLWAMAVHSWFESREIWNRGIAPTGKPWRVELDNCGGLYLDDGKTCRIRISGILIHPAVIDALHRQQKEGRV